MNRFVLTDDAIADDVLYHLSCLVKREREAFHQPESTSELNLKEVADMELLDW